MRKFFICTALSICFIVVSLLSVKSIDVGYTEYEEVETTSTEEEFELKILEYATTTLTETTTTATVTTTAETTAASTTESTEKSLVTTEATDTTKAEVIKETTTTEPVREFVVYKPSTHYVHRNTCRWYDKTCEEIESTEGLECRKCSECKPDIEVITEYVPPTPTVNTDEHYSLNFITEDERVYLCNVVGSEYGSDWVSLYDKACVVATVMNRYYDGGWQGYGRENTIYNVITAPGQYNPNYAVNYYRWNVTQSCIQAVDYYFENQSTFPHYTSFWGDGTRNHFS